MKIQILNLLLLSTSSIIIASHNDPEITIKQGTLRGKVVQTEGGQKFSSFTAIPYAQPPIGELRFRPPVPAAPWEGILDATTTHSLCPQSNLFLKTKTIVGDEDCLHLNVYIPESDGGKLLPVMLYIHGGSWIFESANIYSPNFLMEKDVVLVTINYRLGPLGFLAIEDDKVTGNNGLKDQVLAIKWVKDNIDKFGGDPDSITLFGQAAGGASAHYHMLSPLSRDLIKGVIAQSGTAFAPWALIPRFHVTQRSEMLATKLGCPTENVDKMMECLRAVDAYSIIKEVGSFIEWDIDPIAPFKPVIEPNLPGAFLFEDPIETIKSGQAADIPFVSGLTTDEGGIRAIDLFSQPDLVNDLNKNFETIAPILLSYSESALPKFLGDAAPAIKRFYFQDQAIDLSTKDKFAKMYTDAMFLSGADVAIDLHAKYSKQPVYYYLFGYKDSASYCNFLTGSKEDYGVCHCDELLYLLNHDIMFPEYLPSDSDKRMTKFLTTLWTNFAKFGNPTPETDPFISVKWEPVQVGTQNYYHIKSEKDVTVAQGLYAERAKFWKDLPLNVRKIWIRDEL